jgi:hypothetical protein
MGASSKTIRYGVPVVAGVGLLLILKTVIKRKKNTNSDGTKPSIAPSIADIKIVSSNLTISPDTAALMAQTLYQAMANFGTDEDAIYSVFNKIQSKDDLLLLISKFGLRKNLWGTRAGFIGQDVNLITWLNTDLSKRELSKIRPVFDRFNIPL